MLALSAYLEGVGTLKPMVDGVFPLEQGVEAIKYVRSDQVKGKAIVTI